MTHTHRTFCLLLLAACAAGTEPPPTRGKVQLDIISGDAQADTVAHTLALAVVAQAKAPLAREGLSVPTAPVAAVVVNWFRVVGQDTTFVGASLTDDAGQTRMRWSLGTKTGPQHLIAWALNSEGDRDVYAAAQATALPDQPAVLTPRSTVLHGWVGDTVTAHALIATAVDRYGNAVDSAGLTLSAAAGWTVVGDTLAIATSLGGGSVLVTLDTAQVRIPSSMLYDLRKLVGWNISHACGDTALNLRFRDYDFRQSSGVIDSVQYTATTQEWMLWSTNLRVRHSDATGLWDSTHVRQAVLVSHQGPDGTLTVPYLTENSVLNGAFLQRIDFVPNLPTLWDGAQFHGGSSCLVGWQATEPYAPLTIRKP